MDRKELLEAIQVAAQEDDIDEYNRLKDILNKKPIAKQKSGKTELDLALEKILGKHVFYKKRYYKKGRR